jgi:hypothetical protein
VRKSDLLGNVGQRATAGPLDLKPTSRVVFEDLFTTYGYNTEYHVGYPTLRPQVDGKCKAHLLALLVGRTMIPPRSALRAPNASSEYEGTAAII